MNILFFLEGMSNQDIILLILTIVGTIGGIISILMWIFRKRKKPICEIKNYNIVKDSNKMEGLKILYANKEIPNLSVSKILFYNSGNSDIRKEDVPESNYIAICVSNSYEILDFRIEYVSSVDNNISLKRISKNKIKLFFEFLSGNDGCIIQILSTAKYKEDIFLEGRIMDYGLIFKKDGKTYFNKMINNLLGTRRDFARQISYFVLAMFLAIILGLMSIMPDSYYISMAIPPIWLRIFIGIYAALMLILSLMIIKRRIPRKFKYFYDNYNL